MNQKQNIFLIGPMGAGKTTMGRQIAKRLNMRFEDSDHVIESHTGVDIPLIFEKEGELGFRKREITIIDELSSQHNLVLATGGGAILAEENRRCLMSRGIVIYLHSDIKNLLERVGYDKNRPLLQTPNPAAKLKELMDVRRPLYEETADIIINTGQQSIRSVINMLLDKINTYNQKTSGKR